MRSRPVRAVCFDLPYHSAFFRSVATSVVMQANTTSSWAREEDEVLVTLCSLFGYGQPGLAKVHVPSKRRMQAEIDAKHEQYLRAWVNKVNQKGPRAANEYRDRMGKLRIDANEHLQSTFRDTASLNRDITRSLTTHIKGMLVIKAASTATVVVMGALPGLSASVAAFFVGTGYSVACNFLKAEDSAKAQVVALSLDVGKTGVFKGAEKLAEQQATKAMLADQRAQNILSRVAYDTKKYQAKLAKGGLGKNQAKRVAAGAWKTGAKEQPYRVAAGQASRNAAGRTAFKSGLSKVSTGVSVLFVAKGVWDAATELSETWRKL